MPSRSFYFLRHGQTDWNKEERMQGRTDIPLNETGREQARAARDTLAGHSIDLLCASPLKRAYETAQIVNEHRHLPIITHDSLIERHYGSHEGTTLAEMVEKETQFPELFLPRIGRFPHPREAEPFDEFRIRAVKAVKEILVEHKGNILFVAHEAIFGALSHALIEGDYKPSANATPYRFQIENGIWTCAPL